MGLGPLYPLYWREVKEETPNFPALLRATSPDTMVALPLRAYGPLEKGSQAMQYWPFSLVDLYNWKAQHTHTHTHQVHRHTKIKIIFKKF